MPTRRPLFALLLTVFSVVACSHCSRPASDDAAPEAGPANPQLDARLRRIAAEHPDSVVGVFVRVTRTIGDDEREALEAAGLTVGAVVGDIVTGRLRAGSAERLTRIEFVRYIQLAGTARVHDLLPGVRPDTPD